jgi:hypothetical protein
MARNDRWPRLVAHASLSNQRFRRKVTESRRTLGGPLLPTLTNFHLTFSCRIKIALSLHQKSRQKGVRGSALMLDDPRCRGLATPSCRFAGRILISLERVSLPGAFGYVFKERVDLDLLPAMREVLAGRLFISPSATSQTTLKSDSVRRRAQIWARTIG